MAFTPRSLAAHTACDGYVSYPPYISINERRAGFVDVHIRSSEADGSKEAHIELSDVDFAKLVDSLTVTTRAVGPATAETMLDGEQNIA